jgi:hypothetical protein
MRPYAALTTNRPICRTLFPLGIGVVPVGSSLAAWRTSLPTGGPDCGGNGARHGLGAFRQMCNRTAIGCGSTRTPPIAESKWEINSQGSMYQADTKRGETGARKYGIVEKWRGLMAEPDSPVTGAQHHEVLLVASQVGKYLGDHGRSLIPTRNV